MNKETFLTLAPYLLILIGAYAVYAFLKNTNVGGNSSGQSLWNYYFGTKGKYVPGVGYVGSTANPATTNDLVADNGAVASSKSVNTWGDDVTYLVNSATDTLTGGYDTQGDPNL